MAANDNANPNHVQIGINDTPLTSSIEKGDFKTAEKLIEENEEPSYLNEGPYEKIPLALVLSSEDEFREFPRHLRLAKLLVEGGANPNIRIPQAEWQGASPSPMEHIWTLFDLAIDLCRYGSDGWSSHGGLVDPLFTIGLHDETQLTPVQLKEQLLELLDIFLACGGDPNVLTTASNSTLYHLVMAHPDPNMDLVMKLCEAGGDLNQTNVHGTTPLMDLVTYADGDLAVDILHSIWKKKPDISSLQNPNCSNETALWRSMLAGSPTVATELLHLGANPAPRAIISISKCYSLSRNVEIDVSRPWKIAVNGVSAILAPLLQDSSPYVRHTAAYVGSKFDFNEAPYPFDFHLLNKVFSCAISPVVDNTAVSKCFPQSVLVEIEKIIHGETQFAYDPLSSAIEPQDMVILVFGNLRAGLQQLCVRRIIEHVFFTRPPRKSLELIAKLKGKKLIVQKEKEQSENWDENEEEKVSEVPEVQFSDDIVVEDIDNITHWDVVMELNKMTIYKLVNELLNLPRPLTSRFEIECSRLQLGASLYNFKSIGDCVHGCDGQSDEGSSEPFAEDEYDDDDDDDDDDDETSWFSGFIFSSDEYDDCFYSSTETDEDDSSDDDDDDGDDNDGDSNNGNNDDHCKSETDMPNTLKIDMDFNSTNVVGMDVESTLDGDNLCIQNGDFDELYTLPSIFAGDISEGGTTSSGEGVPVNIHRDKYEAFGNDPCYDTVSSSENSADAMTSDIPHMMEH